jgi:DNA helicase-2/ATP-dependent DNA helicase PcrA
MVVNNRLEVEQKFLKKVQDTILEQIKYQRNRLKEIPLEFKNRYGDVKWGDEDLVKKLTTIALKQLSKLEYSYNNPFFSKIIFSPDDDEEVEIYIGRTGIVDADGNQLVTDWRAPISFLYYAQKCGRAEYEIGGRKITGELKLKSQILIKDGVLIDVRDVDLLAPDELLNPVLSSSAGNRLKGITATAQPEQYAIIRTPLSKNIITQGSAGSGKSNIALSKLAYHAYNGDYNTNQFIVIGPNKYFLNYISSLLPELEAEDIEQYTFLDIMKEQFPDLKEVFNQNLTLRRYYDKKSLSDILSYKSSLQYKEDLDKFIASYLDSLIEDIKFYDETLIEKEEIKRNLLTGGSYKKNADILASSYIARIKARSEALLNTIWTKEKQKFDSMSPNDERHKNYLGVYNDIKTQLEKGCNKVIRNYFKRFSISPLKLYSEFIKSISQYSDDPSEVLDGLKKETLSSLSKKKIYYEDLLALIYLNIKFNDNEESKNIVHVVVDEAQDLGMFEFHVLKMMFKNSTFSLFGDIAQSIYPYKSIADWQQVKSSIFDDKCEIINIEKSYRSTTEIINVANEVLKNLKLSPAIPVMRHGDEVEFVNLVPEEKSDFIVEKIMQLVNTGCKSIALLCENEKEAERKGNELRAKGIDVKNIKEDDEEYNGGICITTSYLAKGLEFDAVIINDASEQIYNSTSKTDMQLLYVGLTRALHNLVVIYHEQLTKGLINCLDNNKIQREQYTKC